MLNATHVTGRVRRGVVAASLAIALGFSVVLTALAAEFDDDEHVDYLQGYYWQGYSWVWLDWNGSGWVYDGGSRTTRSVALDYIWVQGRGQEYCNGYVTDTDWDYQDWGTGSVVYQVSGSGFSSAGSCSWPVWHPCKYFASDGDHRADEGGYFDTASTEAQLVEPISGCV